MNWRKLIQRRQHGLSLWRRLGHLARKLFTTTRTKTKPTDADFTQVIQFFVNRDYVACLQKIMTNFEGAMSHELLRLYVICMQRLSVSLSSTSEKIDAQLLMATANEPWCHALAKMIVGEIELPELLTVASDNQQRCQAYYYAGARLFTEGKTEAAYEKFEISSAIEAGCLECHLAGLEMLPIPLTEQALTAGELHIQQICGLNTRCNTLYKEGKWEETVALATQTSILARRYLGDKHVLYAESLDNLATAQTVLGDFSKAECLYREAIDVFRETASEESVQLGLGICILNFAKFYLTTAQYDKAEQLFHDAAPILEIAVGKNHFLVAQNLGNLATLYQSMGNFKAGEPLFRQALDIARITYGQDSEYYVHHLNNLAVLHLYMNDFVTALPLLREIVEIYGNTTRSKDAVYAELLNNLAGAYTGARRFAEAEETYLEASSIFRRSTTTDHPTFAVILSGLAKIYRLVGNYTKAESTFLESLQIRRVTFGENHPSYSQELCNLANLYAAMDETSKAKELLETALRIDDQMIGQVFSISSEYQRAAYLRTIRGNLDMFLSLLLRSFFNSPEAARSGWSLVLRRKAIEADAQAMQRNAVLGGKYPEVAPKLRELTIVRAQIARKTLDGPGNEDLQTRQKVIAELDRKKELLEAEIARHVPEMNFEHKLRSICPQTVAMTIPPGAVLVEFVRIQVFDFSAVPGLGQSGLKPSRYLAFVIRSGELENIEMIDLGEAEPIDNLISAFRQRVMDEAENYKRGLGIIRSTVRYVTSENVGEQLRKSIFDTLLKSIGGHKRLMISPDSDLTRLPFEVLPANDGGRLIDEYKISYLTAGRDVMRFEFKSNLNSRRPLVAADPDFDLDTNVMRTEAAASSGRRSRDLNRDAMGAFARLPGTRVEGEKIAAMLDAELWTADSALDARLKRCQSPRILHLATHGFFLEDQKRNPNEESFGPGSMGLSDSGMERLVGVRFENPMLRSGLALAGVNTWLKKAELLEEAEDGLLTAEDVSGLDLLDTELVVLSACDTGLGEVRVGEGVFGLRRAFVLAGAKTLVMSLWKVPDEQTRELMEDFYRRILGADGKPPQSRAYALREAQLAIKDKYPEPFYWGAFICQGYDGPLDTRKDG
jgi:CHAT domain-containing protein/Tfp pilus assembly protein PilF